MILKRIPVACLCFFAACVVPAEPQPITAQVPTPISVLGHNPGNDFYLADYEDTVRYFHALAAASVYRNEMSFFTETAQYEHPPLPILPVAAPAPMAAPEPAKTAAPKKQKQPGDATLE